jgi:hypothetical protein
MSDVSDTELLSAFLDGELTAEEQARAEHMLAVSAEARQLLEELRALSGTLQGLPLLKLNEDISARVLQIAERRVLSPEEPDQTGGADKPAAGRAATSLTTPADDSSGGFPWREISWRGLFSPRALIWTAIILIAAFVIHKNVPPENANREQARMDDRKPSSGKRAAASEGKDNPPPRAAWVGPADKAKVADGERLAKMDESRSEGKAAAESQSGLNEKATAENLERDQVEARHFAQGRPANGARQPEPVKELPGENPVRMEAAGGTLAAKGAGGFGGGERALLSENLMNSRKDAAPRDSIAANGSAPAPAMPPAPSAIPPVSAAAPEAPEAPEAPAAAPSAPPMAQKPAEAKSGEMAKRTEPVATVVQLTCSTTASGLFTDLLAHNGLAAKRLVCQSAQQPSDGKIGNGSLIADGRQMPLANAGDSSNRPQQPVSKAPAAANEAQNETMSNSASRGATQAFNGQVQGNLRRGAAGSASDLNGAGGVQQAGAPNNTSFYAQGQTQATNTANFGGVNGNNEPGWFYFECDATDDQLHGLMKQLRERRDAFTLAEAASSPNNTPRGESDGADANHALGNYRYDDQSAGGAAHHAVQPKAAPASPSQSKAPADAALDRKAQKRAYGPATPAAVQSKTAPPPAVATPKKHVVFVLNVVEPVPPAPATPAAPPGK